MNAPRRDLLLVPAELIQRLLDCATTSPGEWAARGQADVDRDDRTLAEVVAVLNYQAPKLPATFSNPNPRPGAIADRKLCARMLVNRSARLLRLLELQGPEPIIESERRLIARALAQFPIDAAVARYEDATDAENEKADHGSRI